LPLHDAGHASAQRCAPWQRLQSEHFEQLIAKAGPAAVPFLECANRIEALTWEVHGDPLEMGDSHGVPLSGSFLPEGGGGQERKGRNKQQTEPLGFHGSMVNGEW
jgi:hypothetical protein